jgi:cytochrome P450 family 142 subfamily A polypeptide 1
MNAKFEELDTMALKTHSGDPWPFYDWLLEQRPLFYDKHNENYMVSRYDDIVRISRDHQTFITEQGVRPQMPGDPTMINQDGRQHTLQRRLVSEGFTPRHIAELGPYVRLLVTELLDAVIESGQCDVVEDLAAPLPMRLIGEMLGHKREDHQKLQEWTDEFVKGGNGPDHVTEAVDEAFDHFSDFHLEAMEKRKECPGKDLLSIWMNADIEGEKLDEDQLLFEHTLLLVGGSETTRNSMSGGLEILMKHPDQLAALIDDPSLIPNAVEEIVRWTVPFVNMARSNSKEVELHGQLIPEGSEIVMLYPAASRDPRHFSDPYTFDIERKFTSPNIAFGIGKHVCLGASLARLELKIFLEEVLPRLGGLRIHGENKPAIEPSCFIRGFKNLPVTFKPGTKSSRYANSDETPKCPFH